MILSTVESISKMYAPSKDAEYTLMTILMNGILEGISNFEYHGNKIRYVNSINAADVPESISVEKRSNINKVTSMQTIRGTQVVSSVKYSNIHIEPAMYKASEVWNVYASVNIVDPTNISNIRECATGIWLASIPKLNEDGVIEIGKMRYYTVMRQRLIPNVPIVTVRRESDRNIITCMLRSENMVTLESVFITMRRSARSSRNIMINIPIAGFKSLDAVGYVRGLIRAQDWQGAMRKIFLILGASETVMNLLQLQMLNTSDVTCSKYIMPGTIGSFSQHYGILLDDYILTSEATMICMMILKFLRVESGEIEPDDRDDCRYKVVESYANLMGKLIRKLIIGIGVNVISKSKADEPAIFDELIDAYVSNAWSVIDDYSDMQISRSIDYTGLVNIIASLQEVVILANPNSSSTTFGEEFDVRMVHPTQRGFLCMLRTADDTNAGLKLYLASDCRISREQYMFGVSRDDDNYQLRMKLSTYPSAQNIIWLHNSIIVGINTYNNIIHLLRQLKLIRPELSWSVEDGVIESRYYYGRMLCKLSDSEMYDTREIDAHENVRNRASTFSILCNEIVYLNRMPPARAMLSAKIMQKCITAHPPPIHQLHSTDYSYISCAQKPLVTTSKSNSFCFGQNVVVGYTTLESLGIEDGIVVNRGSIERGMFHIVKRFSLLWKLRENQKATEYLINVKIGEVVKEGSVLAVFTCTDDQGFETVAKLKHVKPYECKVVDVEITFDTHRLKSRGMIDPKYLIECTVTLTKSGRFKTGNKVSSRFGQKGVVIQVRNEEDMPMIHSMHMKGRCGKCSPPPTVDIIVDPLSIVSRCTISQSVSSMLGLLCTEEGAVAVETPFAGTELVYTSHQSTMRNPVDVNAVSDYTATLIDGVSGYPLADNISIGIEYYMVLNHIAEEKVRISSSNSTSSASGALNMTDAGNYVRYNWQELSALLHAKAYKLLDDLYSETEDAGYYPYCVECEKDCETVEGQCSLCKSSVTYRVQTSKSFTTARRLARVLGIEIGVRAEVLDT